jgi:hypothetical protein
MGSRNLWFLLPKPFAFNECGECDELNTFNVFNEFNESIEHIDCKGTRTHRVGSSRGVKGGAAP